MELVCCVIVCIMVCVYSVYWNSVCCESQREGGDDWNNINTELVCCVIV